MLLRTSNFGENLPQQRKTLISSCGGFQLLEGFYFKPGRASTLGARILSTKGFYFRPQKELQLWEDVYLVPKPLISRLGVSTLEGFYFKPWSASTLGVIYLAPKISISSIGELLIGPGKASISCIKYLQRVWSINPW